MPFTLPRWKTPIAVAFLAGIGIAGWQLLYAAEDPVVALVVEISQIEMRQSICGISLDGLLIILLGLRPIA